LAHLYKLRPPSDNDLPLASWVGLLDFAPAVFGAVLSVGATLCDFRLCAAAFTEASAPGFKSVRDTGLVAGDGEAFCFAAFRPSFWADGALGADPPPLPPLPLLIIIPLLLISRVC
jgi:hypothetical protein